MDVLLLEVPYDSGHHRHRLGLGAMHLVERGAAARLTAAGHRVAHRELSVPSPLPLEMGTGFAVIRGIATEVARAAGAFPVVLAGNCNSALGAMAGLRDPSVGILWFDAHGDCETPETTATGYFDGMGLAILLGEAFRHLRGTVPGFGVLPGDHVLLLGGRQVSDAEHALVARTGATFLSVSDLRAGAMARAIERMAAAGVTKLYVHLDLDVIDPSVAPANTYAEPDGLFPDEIQALVEQAAAMLPLAGGGVASYDPSCDREDRMLEAGLSLIERLPGLAR